MVTSSSWKEYHFIYNHRLLYVFGLAFSRSLTNYAIINVLAWYFTFHRQDLVMSSILSSSHDSLSSVMVLFMANAADSYVGRFHTLLFCNTAYIGGLTLLLTLNPYDVQWLVVITLTLLALGTSVNQLLQEVLEDLVNDIDKSQEQTKERSIARAKIWSRIAKVAAAICTILWVAPDHEAIGGIDSTWGSAFLICIVTMTICLMIFCIGHNNYRQGLLIERPIDVFFRVSHMRIKKLLIKRKSGRITTFSQDESVHNPETKNKEGEGIMQERSPLSVDNIRQEARGCSSYKEDDMVILKSLLRMFPMWAMFLVVSLISATGSTFFQQQYNNLNPNNQIAVQIFELVREVSSVGIPNLYRRLCCLRKNEKVKIGAGMLCGIVSCIFAWQLEVERLEEVNKLDYEEDVTSISFLWLVPQFCVLGCMEGLTREGLLNFYKSQIKQEPLQSYREEYIEFVMGFGKFLNIFLILILNSQLGWFGDTINNSRLDTYYQFLACVFVANFIIYCLISKYYYKNSEECQDLTDNDLNQGLELLACDNHEQDNQDSADNDSEQDLANDDDEQDDQVVADDDQEQDNELLANEDQEQDNQILANDDQDQDNELSSNEDEEQENQLLLGDDIKQDNQLLVNNDLTNRMRSWLAMIRNKIISKQDNQILSTDELQQADD